MKRAEKNELTRQKQRIIVALYLRLRYARRHVKEIQAKGKGWEPMLDQARGSHFEAFMALKAIKELVKE